MRIAVEKANVVGIGRQQKSINIDINIESKVFHLPSKTLEMTRASAVFGYVHHRSMLTQVDIRQNRAID